MISSFLLTTALVLAQVSDEPAAPADGSIAAEQELSLERRREVQRLLGQLEATERARRDEAELALTKQGPLLLPLLPEITNRTSGELKQRLERIRRQLETQAAEQTTVGSFVTLQGTMKLSEALSALEKQTGNRLIDFRGQINQPVGSDSEITVDVTHEPYWSALDQIFDQAGLTIYNYGGPSRAMAFVAQPEGAARRQGRAAYQGLFRVEPTTIYAEKNLRVPSASNMVANLEILWEPRVLPISIRQDLADISLVGSDGEPLPLATTGTISVPVQSTVSGVDIRLAVQLPERTVQKIALLKGRFTALVPGRVEAFEFTELLDARNVERKRGGITVSLDRVRQNSCDVYEFNVRLRMDNGGEALQSHLDWAANNEAILINPQGISVGEPNYEKYLERGNEVGYRYLFPLDQKLDGYKFIYKTPAAMVDVTVDFELHDIDLP